MPRRVVLVFVLVLLCLFQVGVWANLQSAAPAAGGGEDDIFADLAPEGAEPTSFEPEVPMFLATQQDAAVRVSTTPGKATGKPGAKMLKQSIKDAVRRRCVCVCGRC